MHGSDFFSPHGHREVSGLKTENCLSCVDLEKGFDKDKKTDHECES